MGAVELLVPVKGPKSMQKFVHEMVNRLIVSMRHASEVFWKMMWKGTSSFRCL